MEWAELKFKWITKQCYSWGGHFRLLAHSPPAAISESDIPFLPTLVSLIEGEKQEVPESQPTLCLHYPDKWTKPHSSKAFLKRVNKHCHIICFFIVHLSFSSHSQIFNPSANDQLNPSPVVSIYLQIFFSIPALN